MSMKRASAYGRSQETMIAFAKKFNSILACPNLYCCPILQETMLNDGCFVNVGAGRLIAFDWEIRERLKSFKPGEFRFSTLTEFERKFAPEKNTQLFIQCDSQELYIAAAWRSDFMESAATRHTVEADNGKENTLRRETSHFHIYALDDLSPFKRMVERALNTGTYSHSVFDE